MFEAASLVEERLGVELCAVDDTGRAVRILYGLVRWAGAFGPCPLLARQGMMSSFSLMKYIVSRIHRF